MDNEQLHLDFGNLKLVRAGSRQCEEKYDRWLVDRVWLQAGTGMLAGMPKTGKTWVAIDMAVSVASGTPFLGKYPTQQGPVVIYSPEGPDEELDERIHQVAVRRGLDENDLPLHIIDSHQLFLNSTLDQQDIRLMAEKVQPVLTIFDPLVECFNGNENHNEEVNLMARFLTKLAKEASTAIMLTHHMQKSGKQIRGASALEAFGDSYIYISRSKIGRVYMEFVQRHAAPADPVDLELTTVDGNTCYRVIESAPEEKPESLKDRILAFLKTQTEPLSLRKIREAVKGDSHKYKQVFNQLKFFGEARQTDHGWEYVPEEERPASSPSGQEPETTETKQETAPPEEPHKGPETADTAPETETQATPPQSSPSAQDPE